jgi:hypothetical protein
MANNDIENNLPAVVVLIAYKNKMWDGTLLAAIGLIAKEFH